MTIHLDNIDITTTGKTAFDETLTRVAESGSSDNEGLQLVEVEDFSIKLPGLFSVEFECFPVVEQSWLEEDIVTKRRYRVSAKSLVVPDKNRFIDDDETENAEIER